MFGQLTVSAETTALIDFNSGYYLLRSVGNDSYIGYSDTVDDSTGFCLVADTDYMIRVKGEMYIYALSETVVHYLSQ